MTTTRRQLTDTHWHSGSYYGAYQVPVDEMETHARRLRRQGGYPELWSEEFYEKCLATWNEDHTKEVKPQSWPATLPFFNDKRDEWEVRAYEDCCRDRRIYEEGFENGKRAAALYPKGHNQ